MAVFYKQNEMIDERITPETAKLAHERGFKEICEYETSASDIGEGWKIKCKEKEGWVEYILPTQSFLQRWLREVHGIQIEIHYWPEETRGDGRKVVYDFSTNLTMDSDKQFDTYEEALETCLQEALKLI